MGQTKTQPETRPLGDLIRRTWDAADRRHAQADALIERANRQKAEAKALDRHATAVLRQGAEAKAEAEKLFFDVGRMLLGLRQQVKHGCWAKTVKRLGRSERRARELMELARGDTNLEAQRQRTREAMRRLRDNSASHDGYADLPPARNVRNIPYLRGVAEPRTISAPHYVREVAAARTISAPHYVRDPPGLVPEDRAQEYKNHLADMCRDVLAARDFWDEHFAGWQEFEISSDLKTLVAEAAAAFAALAATLERKKPSGEVPP
jgi:hypothetical protein